ncbi:MAG: hypothetical protein AAFY84_11115 [Pseudomonadota bacterium]
MTEFASETVVNCRRMFDSAMDRIHDADILSTQIWVRTDAASLLKILGLEILLKCAVRFEDGNYRQGHKYAALWQTLSPSSRERVIAEAENRFTTHFSAQDVEAALPNWQKVFCKGRYEYEEFENGALIVDLDHAIENKDPVEGAFSYFPNELQGLLFGLRIILEEQLGVKHDLSY